MASKTSAIIAWSVSSLSLYMHIAYGNGKEGTFSYFYESQGLGRGRAVGDRGQRRERMCLRRQSPRLSLCPLRCRR